MKLLKGTAFSNLLLLVIITLESSPVQSEETTVCYYCPGLGPCPDETATTINCEGEFPCRKFQITRPDGTVSLSRGCNPPSHDPCFPDKLGFGLAAGCKEDTGEHIKECGPSYTADTKLKYCACKGEKCNHQNAFGFGGDGRGGGSGGVSGNLSSFKWTITEAGLMMASILIAICGH